MDDAWFWLSFLALFVQFGLVVVSGWVASRINKRLASVLCPLFFVVGVCTGWSTYLYVKSVQPVSLANLPLIPLSFTPIFIGLGFSIGRSHVRGKEIAEKTLADWQAQLAKDEAAGSNPLVIAEDLRGIAGILADALGRVDEAVVVYERAYAIYKAELNTHPFVRPYYWQYASLLRSVGRFEDARKVEAELT